MGNHKIVRLTAENVKRIQAVEVKPDGNTVIIGGKNGNGKTSLLDAIAMAVGGVSHSPDEVIRRGTKESRVVVELDDIVITRKVTKKGSYLKVTAKGSNKAMASPQAILDKMVGTLTFDPLEFCRMDSKKQTATLQRMIGLDFVDHDIARQVMYDDRTSINQGLKDKKALLASYEWDETAPENEVSISGLTDDLNFADKRNRDNSEARSKLANIKAHHTSCIREDQILAGRIEELEKERKEVQARAKKYADRLPKGEAVCKKLKDVDTDAIKDRIREADGLNAAVRQNIEHSRLAGEVKALAENANNLTLQLETADHFREEKMRQAKYPVKGLELSVDGLRYNGTLFNECSAAERLRVSTAMGLSMNPELRVILIRDGSYLDDDSLAMLAEMAKEADAQLWIERVGEGEECAVIIEDGMVKEAVQS